MAKLRHVAMQVPNLEKASSFYEEVFGMKRLVYGETPYGNVQMMSDGLVTLARLNFPEGTIGGQGGPDWSGLHHIGFVVDDHDETAKKINENGGSYFTTLPDNIEGLLAEVKYKDLNGVVIDVSEHEWET